MYFYFFSATASIGRPLSKIVAVSGFVHTRKTLVSTLHGLSDSGQRLAMSLFGATAGLRKNMGKPDHCPTRLKIFSAKCLISNAGFSLTLRRE